MRSTTHRVLALWIISGWKANGCVRALIHPPQAWKDITCECAQTFVPGLLQHMLRQRRAQLAEQMVEYDTPTDTAGNSRAGWGRSARGDEAQSSFGARRGRGRGCALSAPAHLLQYYTFILVVLYTRMHDIGMVARALCVLCTLQKHSEACTVHEGA